MGTQTKSGTLADGACSKYYVAKLFQLNHRRAVLHAQNANLRNSEIRGQRSEIRSRATGADRETRIKNGLRIFGLRWLRSEVRDQRQL